jgi:hypothetical protein
VSGRGWSPTPDWGLPPSDGPCWTQEGNEELARREERESREAAEEWKMNSLLEKWGLVEEDGMVNWCSESPCPLSPLGQLREESPVPSLISESPSDSLDDHEDLIQDLQIRSTAWSALGEVIGLLKEAGMVVDEKELVVDGLVATKNGRMTREWIGKFRDLYL